MTSDQVNTAIREATGIQRNDFDSDLNAMHEAEKVFDDDPNNRVFYIGELWGVLGLAEACYEQEARPNDFYFAVAHATAPQRAEAFLRTINKWTTA